MLCVVELFQGLRLGLCLLFLFQPRERFGLVLLAVFLAFACFCPRLALFSSWDVTDLVATFLLALYFS